MKRRLAFFFRRFKFSRDWRWVTRELLAALVEQMMKGRESRSAEYRRQQRLTYAEQYIAAIKERQDSCTHLKGGKIGYTRDFAVGKHTFIDGHVEVKCLLCGKKFDPNGLEAKLMLSSTTNHPSSSETVGVIQDRENVCEAVFQDTMETPGDDTIWSAPGAAITKKIWDMYRMGISRRGQKKPLDKLMGL